MTGQKSDFPCTICNKFYVSKNSLGNHNRKFHPKNNNTTVVNGCHSVVNSNKDVVIPKTANKICKFCNKVLCDRFSRYRHEKNYKEKDKTSQKSLIETRTF